MLTWKLMTDVENRFVVAKQEAGQGRDRLGVWSQQMQTVTYGMEKDKVLLCSTGKYIQYIGVNHNKIFLFFRKYICVKIF